MKNRRLPPPLPVQRLGLVVVVVLLLSPAFTTAFQLSPPILHHGRVTSTATTSRGDTTATMRYIPSNPKLIPQKVILPILQASTTIGPTKQDSLQNKRFVGKWKTLIHRGMSSLASTVLRTNRLLWLQQRLSRLRRRIVLATALCCLLLSPAHTAAVTGGRVGGGNFRSSPAPRVRSAPSSSRGSSSFGGGGIRIMHHSNYYRPPQYHYHRPPSTTIIPIFMPSRNTHRHVLVDNNNDSRLVVATSQRKNPVADLVVVAGTVAAVAYVAKKAANDEAATTNNNIHVGSLTVTFSLPNTNKNDRYQQQQQPSLLEQIKRIAGTADTVDGVGELVSDVCLELLRNMDRIECAYGEQDATSYKSMEAAEQAYRRKSVLMQSKFDRFVVNKFNAKDKAASSSLPPGLSGGSDDGESTRPTLGLVTIQYATERALKHTGPKLLTRDDLRSALSELASCRPTAAEVIWAPGMADEVLDAPTVYSLFPQLVPI
jgi:uncharacterized membrane protein